METPDVLMQFCSEWDRAMTRNNAEEIGRYMSDYWGIVGTSGGITPASIFLGHIASGDLVHTRMDSDEMRIRVYGNSGVVTSRGTSAGHFKGEAFSFYEWSSNFFIRQGENWRCVLTMLTPAQQMKG